MLQMAFLLAVTCCVTLPRAMCDVVAATKPGEMGSSSGREVASALWRLADEVRLSRREWLSDLVLYLLASGIPVVGATVVTWKIAKSEERRRDLQKRQRGGNTKLYCLSEILNNTRVLCTQYPAEPAESSLRAVNFDSAYRSRLLKIAEGLVQHLSFRGRDINAELLMELPSQDMDAILAGYRDCDLVVRCLASGDAEMLPSAFISAIGTTRDALLRLHPASTTGTDDEDLWQDLSKAEDGWLRAMALLNIPPDVVAAHQSSVDQGRRRLQDARPGVDLDCGPCGV